MEGEGDKIVTQTLIECCFASLNSPNDFLITIEFPASENGFAYFDSVSFGVHGLIADVEIEILDPASEPSGGIVANLGRLLHSYRTWEDELGLLVTRIPEFRVPESERKIDSKFKDRDSAHFST